MPTAFTTCLCIHLSTRASSINQPTCGIARYIEHRTIFATMVETRTRDHGTSDKKPQHAKKANGLGKSYKAPKSDKRGQQQPATKRGHSEEPSDHPAEDEGATSPEPKKAKHDKDEGITQAKGIQDSSSNSKVEDIIAKYGALPLSDIGLSEPTSPTSETILALVLHAMLTSARISHELAYKSVRCLIEAGYHNVETLSKSSWQERTEVLTEGGYTRYREKTATALGELAEFVQGEYGKFVGHPSLQALCYHGLFIRAFTRRSQFIIYG